MSEKTMGNVREHRRRFYPQYMRHGQVHTAGQGFASEKLAWDWLRREQALITEEALTGKAVWTPPGQRRGSAPEGDAQGAITLREHALWWIEHRTTPRGTPLAPRTRAEYVKYLDGRLAPLAALPLVDLTRAHIDQWWKTNEDSHAIRAHAYAFMKSVFKDAVDRELVLENPCRVDNASRRVSQRPKAVQNELITSLSHADLAALADAMDAPRWRAFVFFLAYTGLRPGEALALTRGDLQQRVGTEGVPRWVVSVTKAVTSSRDKGQHLKGPKTAGSIRYVPLPPHLAEILEGHLGRYSAAGKESLVFPGTYSKNPYGTTTQVLGTSPKVRRGRNRSEVPRQPTGFYAARLAIGKPDLRLYDLRAWARHAWRMAGISDFDCELLLGHELPRVAGAYATLDRAALWPLLDRLSEQAGWNPPRRAQAENADPDTSALAHILNAMGPAQLARTLSALPEGQRAEVLPLVPPQHLAAVFSHLTAGLSQSGAKPPGV
ncbi:hypothetical protein [Tessaracoccus sp. MC1756]|uniref:tyrosine-type recombinase/integrase n=1 Tax=Tessaracoccus sp. MC1756 TaxID=2760311 RepID=UPI00160484DA|nr:hypothetical protein [Tessaracoccus sp. MC1756]MBB1510607.1 hypothetical protein [Tessaracoccus sp. MC1756]